MASDNPMVEWNLDLTEDNVLCGFLQSFSFPDKLTFQGRGYNLTKAYGTFWSQFYDNQFCSDKLRKLPKVSLGNEKLKSLARIIKRGWEDERYIPTKFAEIFFKSCIFGKETAISAESILDFFEDDKDVDLVKKLLVVRKSLIDDESLSVLKKYCSTGSISTSNTIEEACIGVVQQILDELDGVIQEWNKELEDLLDMKEFNFVLKKRNECLARSMGPPINDYDDLTNLEEDLPHRIWTTFFKGWTDDKIDFYFKMLVRNNSVVCRCGGFGSKHLMGNDGSDCLVEMNTARHDWVLHVIKEKLDEAMCKEGTFFSSSDDWTLLSRLHSVNQCYSWPKELDMQIDDKPPHLLVYSMAPQKKVMIVEVSIMWEEWYKLSPVERIYNTKTKEFKSTVEKLEKNGFEVQFKDIEMGCRGILCRDLYKLLKEDFKMGHGEVSKTMEEVSKELVTFPYQEYFRRTTLKRKIQD